MFNLGPMELVVILVLALIIFGPGKLPEVGKALGQSLNEFRRASQRAGSASGRPAGNGEAPSAGSTAAQPQAREAATSVPSAEGPAAEQEEDRTV